MHTRIELFKSFEHGSGTRQTRLRFNEPFSVMPRFDRHEIIEQSLVYSRTKITRAEVPLIGDDGGRGFVRFGQVDGSIDLKKGQKIHMPLGEPMAKFKLDPLTGEMVPEHSPVTVSVGVGPTTSEAIKNSDIYVAMDLPAGGGRFISINYDFLFEPNGIQRILITEGWISVKDGSRGPIVLPSGAEFDKIKFTIVKE